MVSKPEQDPSETNANDDDDAIWRDLVARLEGPSAAGYSLDGFDEPSSPAGAGIDSDSAAPIGKPTSFDDFDPLGISRAPHSSPRGNGADEDTGPAPGTGPPGPRDYAAEVPWPDGDDFVPEDPPPLSAVEPALMLAWTGAVGGPIALLFTALLWRGAPLTAILAMIAAFVVSAGYLMFRLPAQRDDDGDDGAVV
ncbi:hypothetical protein IV500_14095 [Paeniglutamicibacter antarcticus]|uniref:Uncharacterized protein n=1 Tax=Arthrobacter terrae TaxID=2935737 RepID=A0A931CQG3_9MICC|nr:hypothetical protein [Arthrobacter terrae]MBG0740510.1 hypothetical protein [Arthrobacter terrae]